MKFSSCKEKEEKYSRLREVIKEYRNSPGPLIQILHRAQNIFGYLPKEVQRFVAKEIGTSFSRVYGVVTFYDFFRLDPVGKYNVTICLGTACYVRGGWKILEALERELAVEEGKTTKDRLFTLTTARCFGSCGLAPAMMVDKEVYGRLNSEKALEIIEGYRAKNE